MNIVCGKCGHASPLGHIFCTQCGARLNLTNVDEAIEQDQQVRKSRAYLKAILAPLIVVLIVLTALLLWPRKPFAEGAGSSGRSDAIDAAFASMERMVDFGSEGNIMPVAMKEEDMNAWLAALGGTAGGKWSATVNLSSNKFGFRVIRGIGPYHFRMGKRRLDVPRVSLSYEVFGKADKGRLAVLRAAIGHMPMAGPLKKPVASMAAALFKDRQREKKVYSKLAGITIEEGEAIANVRSP